MIRNRVRIRFSKAGDLQWISHRDLLRAFERLFRRAGLRLSMSEGFHPKPRMHFPSALALGIRGTHEVMEVELAEDADLPTLRERLAVHAPPGLEVLSVAPAPAKARLTAMHYEVPLPEDRRLQAQKAVARLTALAEYRVQRAGRTTSFDLREAIVELAMDGNVLRMRLRAAQPVEARPQEVLEALGLGDLAASAGCLTRTDVEVA